MISEVIKHHKSKVTRSTCYVCENPAGQYRRFVSEEYSIIQCEECGLEYTDPIPKDADLKLFYAQYEDIRADRRVVELNAQEHLKLLEKFGWKSESITLDFGSGTEVFLEVAGDNCYGVDLKSDFHPRIKQSLNELGNLEWDCITLWGVLEHLPNPKKDISDLASRLKPEGLLALTTVNAESMIPYYYKPPEHLSYWTRTAFDVLAEQVGLKIIEYEPYYMYQLGQIYLQRLLSRTPKRYLQDLSSDLPEIVYVPTNEVRVLMRKVTDETA